MKKYLNNSNFFEKTIKIRHKSLICTKKTAIWNYFNSIMLQNVEMNLLLITKTIIMKRVKLQNRVRKRISKSECINHSEMTLCNYMQMFKRVKNKSEHSASLLQTIDNTKAHLLKYCVKDLPLKDIDKKFVIGFVKYLAHEARELRHGGVKRIRSSSAQIYLRLFSGCLKMAFKDHLIARNPWEDINVEDLRCVTKVYENREYLTIEEIKIMENTVIKNSDIKKAFLFGCFTGLRISDINNIKWSDIKEKENGKYLSIIMQKTKRPIYIKLNNCSLKWMPEKTDSEKVFNLPKHLGGVNPTIKSWAKKAGIAKNISFHTSRHTFATLQLTLGTDIYVVSKLLGHKSVLTTQIYADIIDRKRDEAMDIIDKVF